MMAQDWSLLERLCAARGVSGAEDEVRELILKEIRPCAEKIEVSPLGNILAFRRGEKRPATRLMLDAHMDEAGLIVTRVTEGGLLKFEPVGGIDRRALPGKSVTVGENIPGVIGAVPVHLLERDEREKCVPLKDLYIDIGALSREEALERVRPGDTAAFAPFFRAARGALMGKALEGRAGCALLIELMRAGMKYDTLFAFTVQGETGLAGAKTAAFSAAPEAALVVGAAEAGDAPGAEKGRQSCRPGAGPAIPFLDRRTVYDRRYCRMAAEAARRAGVPCQPVRGVSGGNDAGAVHTSRAGVRTAAVLLPCRCPRSAAGVAAQSDYLAARRLAACLAEAIEERNVHEQPLC
jgi:endoglucanase